MKLLAVAFYVCAAAFAFYCCARCEGYFESGWWHRGAER